MALAASLTVFLTAVAGTKAEAARKAKEAGDTAISEPPMNYILEEEPKKKEEPRGAQEAPRAEKQRKGPEAAKECGFIAISKSFMNYADAVAFCRKHGGRLPRINNSDSWDGLNPPYQNISIDCFGYVGRPWSEVGLPRGVYWTGTAHTDDQGVLWVVAGLGGAPVVVTYGTQWRDGRVACVP